MNIVVYQFNNPFIRPLLQRVFTSVGAGEIHNFWTLPMDNNLKKPYPPGIQIFERAGDWISIMANDHEKMAFDRQIPLDAEMIARMAPYEHDCKKIILRHIKNFPAVLRGNRKGVYRFWDNLLVHTGNAYSSDCLPYYDLHAMYLRYLRYWFDFYTRNKIDLVFSEFIPHGSMDFIGYQVSRLFNIPAAYGYFTPATGYFYFLSDYQDIDPGFPARIEALKKQYRPDEFELHPMLAGELERAVKKPDELVSTGIGNMKKVNELDAILSANEKEINRKLYQVYPYLVEKPDFKTRLWMKLSGLIIKSPWGRRNRFSRKLMEFYEKNCSAPDYNRKYVYMALHFQPELSSLPLGEQYETQMLIAQMLDYYLPDDWLIYVKEHTRLSDINSRPIGFYEELLKLKKVRIVPIKTNTFHLIQGCRATAAVTGTVGYEGLFSNKPFLMFGNQITQYAPGVFRIRSGEECKAAIEAIVKGVNISIDELKYFLKAMEMKGLFVGPGRYSYAEKEISNEQWEEALYEAYVNLINNTVHEKVS